MLKTTPKCLENRIHGTFRVFQKRKMKGLSKLATFRILWCWYVRINIFPLGILCGDQLENWAVKLHSCCHFGLNSKEIEFLLTRPEKTYGKDVAVKFDVPESQLKINSMYLWGIRKRVDQHITCRERPKGLSASGILTFNAMLMKMSFPSQERRQPFSITAWVLTKLGTHTY